MMYYLCQNISQCNSMKIFHHEPIFSFRNIFHNMRARRERPTDFELFRILPLLIPRKTLIPAYLHDQTLIRRGLYRPIHCRVLPLKKNLQKLQRLHFPIMIIYLHIADIRVHFFGFGSRSSMIPSLIKLIQPTRFKNEFFFF